MLIIYPGYITEATNDGLYAGVKTGGRMTLLGGPFQDVDDVLDVCFDHQMQYELPTTRYFELQVSGDKQIVTMLPREALPAEDGDQEQASRDLLRSILKSKQVG